MKILVIGATGYIGSVVAERFRDAGHHVVALVRAADAPDVPTGLEVRLGDLAEPDSLDAAVTADVDGVVNLATPVGAEVDVAAAAALCRRLRGTDRVLVYTSGTWVLGRTGPWPVDEDRAPDPIELVGHRPDVERHVLEAASDRVRAVVIRPGIVYGRGSGIPRLLVELAREHGVGRYVGAEDVHWPMVHVDDLADLFLAAVEGAHPGALLHGVDEEAVSVASLAGAAGRVAGAVGEPRAWPLAEAQAALGAAFAEALALHQVVSGDRARRELGWRPRSTGALHELTHGSYGRTHLPETA
jgi:nucleoside-diphosphate-sugar epimerase